MASKLLRCMMTFAPVVMLSTANVQAKENTAVTKTSDILARDAYIIGQPQRIAPIPLEEMSPEARAEAEAFRSANAALSANPTKPGEVPPMVSTMVRHPNLWRQHTAMAKEFFNGSISARDRELVVLTVAWLCKAPVEWGEHVSIGKRAGLSDEEIQRVKIGSSAADWNAHDRALVKAVEELQSDAMITDETWAILAQSYNDKQLIELPMLIGQYMTVAFYQNSLRLPPRPGNRGLHTQ